MFRTTIWLQIQLRIDSFGRLSRLLLIIRLLMLILFISHNITIKIIVYNFLLFSCLVNAHLAVVMFPIDRKLHISLLLTLVLGIVYAITSAAQHVAC